MPETDLRNEPSDVGRLGRDLYARVVKPQLRPEDDDKYVAIDVDTGAFEVDASDIEAVMRLHSRRAGARVWLERAGWPAACKIRTLSGAGSS